MDASSFRYFYMAFNLGYRKNKTQKITKKDSLFDFNVGYIATVFLGICFVSLGALVMYNSGISFQVVGVYLQVNL